MAIATTEVVRSFRYNGMTLADPAPDKTPEQVMEIYGFRYRELLNAVVEGPVTNKGVATYTFARAAGSKGLSNLTEMRRIAQGTAAEKHSPLERATVADIKENKACSTIVQTVVNSRAAAAPILPGSTAYSRFG